MPGAAAARCGAELSRARAEAGVIERTQERAAGVDTHPRRPDLSATMAIGFDDHFEWRVVRVVSFECLASRPSIPRHHGSLAIQGHGNRTARVFTEQLAELPLPAEHPGGIVHARGDARLEIR